jgi:hypothetical protein
MIITRKATFFLGIFIFIIPFLGFPSTWKMALTIISGVTLVILSMQVNLPKRFAPRTRKEKPIPTPHISPIITENIPTHSPQPPQPSQPIVTKVSEVKPRKRAVKKSNGPVS